MHILACIHALHRFFFHVSGHESKHFVVRIYESLAVAAFMKKNIKKNYLSIELKVFEYCVIKNCQCMHYHMLIESLGSCNWKTIGNRKKGLKINGMEA